MLSGSPARGFSTVASSLHGGPSARLWDNVPQKRCSPNSSLDCDVTVTLLDQQGLGSRHLVAAFREHLLSKDESSVLGAGETGEGGTNPKV